MAVLFFYGLVRIPMAEAIAISFVSPIIALYLAAAFLGETIRPRAVAACVLGLVGVGVIAWSRIGAGEMTSRAAEGTMAVLCSAVFYAVNLVMQRRQAMVARPAEIALFQNLNLTAIFLALAPFYLVWPDAGTLVLAAAGAVLATAALLLLAWGYARAEAQVLLPVEYTGFLWAALLGWAMFGERLEAGTVAGAALIVAGCWLGAGNATDSA